MKTQRALRECLYWLRYCIYLGWKRADINALEDLWWKYHEDNGRLREPKK